MKKKPKSHHLEDILADTDSASYEIWDNFVKPFIKYMMLETGVLEPQHWLNVFFHAGKDPRFCSLNLFCTDLYNAIQFLGRY